MLGESNELLYIGKAGNLRRRLQQHAKAALVGATPRDVLRGASVTTVRWEEVATEAAADREADLIVALAPRLNASIASDGRWTFVDVAVGADSMTIAQTRDPAAPVVGRRFGCFPHLGPGAGSRRSEGCTEGLAAFARLVWAAATDDPRARVPAAISGPSLGPLPVRLPAPAGIAAGVSRLFGGSSAAVIAALHDRARVTRPPVERPGIDRDAGRARDFFDHGPRPMRDLRRRAGLASGPVVADQVRAALRREVEAITGPFQVPDVAEAAVRLVGARRARAIAEWTARNA